MKITLLLILFPLLSFLLSGILGSMFKVKWFTGKSDYIGIVSVGISLLLSYYLLFKVMNGFVIQENWKSWIVSGGLSTNFGGYVDSLTAIMLVVVTTISFFVHLYSVGYMHGDPGYDRFFAYLGLFTFSMLILLLSPNFLQLFFGWEGVGLSSYLLIGFWHKKRSAANAAIKAFLMNRIGDSLFILGIIVVFWTFKTLNFQNVFSNVHTVSPNVLSLIGLLLLGGAVGKSAQFPLHTWLPDAMEGPTPVSALIHAATMVAAGVFMVARCSPIYDGGYILPVVGIIGTMTAFGAAAVGVTQFDIKRILAYSTLSQLGYMFAALGVGAYVYAIFHLFTHAFFKALLFLGSGSIIHGMGGEQDIRKMGGLYRYMKITAITFITAALSLVGIPPLAGYFSKDRIVGATFTNGHYIFWFFLTGGAFLTALYMGRLVFLVFFGKERFGENVREHLHESPWVMAVPLIGLAIPAALVGFVGCCFERFLSTSIPNHVSAVSHGTELTLLSLTVALSIVGLLITAYIYLWNKISPEKITSAFGPVYTLIYRKYYFEEIYNLLFVNGVGFGLGRVLNVVDRYVIDGTVNGIASITRWSGEILRNTQTGVVNTYVAYMVAGTLIVMIIIWLA